jgi:hypothetical protein
LTILTGLLDPSTLLAGLGIGLIAYLELRGASDLRRLDARATRRLACNQIFLGVIIVAFAGFHLAQALLGAGPLSSGASDPEVSQVLGSFDNLARGISAAFYGAIILVGIVGPGSTALYYASRRKHIEDYLSHAPPWIVDLNRSGISV